MLVPAISLLLSTNLYLESPFRLSMANGRIAELRYADDKDRVNVVADRRTLGDVNVAYRQGGSDWRQSSTHASADPSVNTRVGADLQVASSFEPQGQRLVWRVRLQNLSKEPMEIGGLSIPLPMRTRPGRAPSPFVLKHSFVSGSGSFIFWMKPNSVGRYLTLTCLDGTSLEYWNHDSTGTYQAFIHSIAEEPTIKAHEGRWRLPHTSKALPPNGSAEYGFVLEWAKDLAGVRDILARNGKLDVQIAPGMTIPSDLFTEVALRSDAKIESLTAEFPAKTDIRFVRTNRGYRIYKVQFKQLGENLLTVNQAHGAKTYLEFFSCQPVETLIKKRGAFLARSQQHKPDKWYDGLLAEWNMKSEVQLSPDNYDKITGWRIYEVTCDDPGLGKPGFLASKNAEYPVQAEVTALDDYIEHFVWGGLQQTDKEPYPYSIYGIPDWKTLRDSKAPDPTKGVAHVWRCYDYPHIILMYHSMYRVAAQHPTIQTHMPALDYLKRAYHTAVAMFTVPAKLVKWSAYDTGFYNEVTIPRLIDDLRSEGLDAEANELQGYWEKKVKTFVQGRVDLFGSEYAFDSTGFESTEALANYALANGKRLGIDESQANRFLQQQMAANVFCRGNIEPAYYYLGSDYRGDGGDGYVLSYMAQMGGTSVLDYYLYHNDDPAYLRLGYQSILSSWALMNAGTSESGYGYWYPGQANDGGAGGGFEPAAYGSTWLGQPHSRGSWFYSCEIDLGFSGALRAARTVVADDPIFGRFCYGGLGAQKGAEYRFIPKDGLRRRLSIRVNRLSADVELNADRFAPQSEIVLDEKAHKLSFWLEPTDSPKASISTHGLTPSIFVEGRTVSPVDGACLIGPSNSRRLVTVSLSR